MQPRKYNNQNLQGLWGYFLPIQYMVQLKSIHTLYIDELGITFFNKLAIRVGPRRYYI